MQGYLLCPAICTDPVSCGSINHRRTPTMTTRCPPVRRVYKVWMQRVYVNMEPEHTSHCTRRRHSRPTSIPFSSEMKASGWSLGGYERAHLYLRIFSIQQSQLGPASVDYHLCHFAFPLCSHTQAPVRLCLCFHDCMARCPCRCRLSR